MTGFDLAAVMDELAARAAATGLFEDRAYGWPKSALTAPAFVVGYPAQIDLDATFDWSNRGTVPCWAVCGVADDLSARDVLSSFLVAVKTALDGEAAGVWQSARAGTVTIEVNTYPDGTELLEARFDVDVIT